MTITQALATSKKVTATQKKALVAPRTMCFSPQMKWIIFYYLSISNKEKLFWGELCQPWKSGFGSLLFNRVLVGTERLMKTSVVSDVLTLSEDSVQLQNQHQ